MSAQSLRHPCAIGLCLLIAMTAGACADRPECSAGAQQLCQCESVQSFRLCGVDARWGQCLCIANQDDGSIGETPDAQTPSDLDRISTADTGAQQDAGLSVLEDTKGPIDTDILAPRKPEMCNGIDDDGDGAVDEWTAISNDQCTSLIEGTTFLMGCQGGDDQCDADESPAHEVSLAAFRADRTEVSQSAWASCVDAGVCEPPSGYYTPVLSADYPVTMVTAAQAETYCVWRGGHLPTEAQWERLSNGGKGRRWPWGGASANCERANLLGCGGIPSRVGSRAQSGASLEGLFDLAGNVAEWVIDDYDSEIYASHKEGVSEPSVTKIDATVGVARGGSMYWPASQARSSNRMPMQNNATYPDLGLRCVYAP